MAFYTTVETTLPDFESLYALVELARKQGCLEWATMMETKIHKLEVVFGSAKI